MARKLKVKERKLYTNLKGTTVVAVEDVSSGDDPVIDGMVVKGRGDYVEMYESEFLELYPREVQRIVID